VHRPERRAGRPQADRPRAPRLPQAARQGRARAPAPAHGRARPAGRADQIGRENLVYAIKQNLRLETRRRAQQHGTAPVDPYPDLEAPTEHTGIAFTRGVKLAIAIGTLLGAAFLFAIFVLPFLFSSGSTTDVTLRLVNDTHQQATVRGCSDPDCTDMWMHADLDRGLATERSVPNDDLVEDLRVDRGGEETCLPLRVHDGYVRYGSDPSVVLVARLSRATPCPGTTVLPEKGREQGL
jgi:hypothetical protein